MALKLKIALLASLMLNYAPDVNNRAASVASFLDTTDSSMSMYDSIMEENGTSFNSRPLCFIPYAMSDVDNRSELMCCSQGPFSWQLGKGEVEQVMNSRPTLKMKARPNRMTQQSFDANVFVLNLHSSHFQGNLPGFRDADALKALFCQDNPLATADDLFRFVVERDLPPSLLVPVSNKGK